MDAPWPASAWALLLGLTALITVVICILQAWVLLIFPIGLIVVFVARMWYERNWF